MCFTGIARYFIFAELRNCLVCLFLGNIFAHSCSPEGFSSQLVILSSALSVGNSYTRQALLSKERYIRISRCSGGKVLEMKHLINLT